LLKITWWGHACIELECDNVKLLIDPHDGTSIGVNIPRPRVKPDYILVTHEHYDHNAVEPFLETAKSVIREKVGSFKLGPYSVKGVRLPHDEFEGKVRGHVVAYRIECKGIKLVHFSDLGRTLNDREIAELEPPVNIGIVPAGDVYTLHPIDAIKVVEQVGALIAIPVHYWVPGVYLPLDTVELFITNARKKGWVIRRMDSNSIVVSVDDLPEKPTIVVLSMPKG